MYRLDECPAPANWAELPGHRFANEYDLMPDEELAPMIANMEKGVYQTDKPIVLFGLEILDGRNRRTAAMRAGKTPSFVDFNGTDVEAEAFVRAANEDRRHLNPEALKMRRAARVERVKAKRKAGKSTREIAAEEGVSQPQVVRDLAEAVQADTPVSERTNGPTKRERDAEANRLRVKDYLEHNPEATDRAAGKALGLSHQTVMRARKTINLPRGKPAEREPGDDTAEEAAAAAESAVPVGAILRNASPVKKLMEKLIRQLDDFARPIKRLNGPDHKGVLALVKRAMDAFDSWVVKLQKE